MWITLPFDILSNIFSFLPPDSLACADSTCRTWHQIARAYPFQRPHPPWFVAMPSRTRQPSCHLHNPNANTWHFIPLHDVIPQPVRPVASIGALLLLKPAASVTTHFIICNPFTKRVRQLPSFNRARTNPTVGVVEEEQSSFRIYLAGGMVEESLYETTVERYDWGDDKWRVVGSMPVEFSVRLTVWTPNESVFSGGILYWITSARAYTVVGFDVGRNTWREVSVPLGDRLEFASLVGREGMVLLVGAVGGESAYVWGLGWGGVCGVVCQVPPELGRRLVGEKLDWGSTKCVGINGAICLYRELGLGMVVWREKGRRRWEWEWVEGKKRVQNIGVRGLLLQPNRGTHFLSKPEHFHPSKHDVRI